MSRLSKSQIDRLGDRLRSGLATDDDVRLLDEYRRAFRLAYDLVRFRVKELTGLTPSGRPAKSSTAITEKLAREHARLSQIQDIAGCRIVVLNTVVQDRVTTDLRAAFPTARVVDRRATPSHGYRAIHVIATVHDLPVEIQVRTVIQHVWAQLSERLSDEIDAGLKYGGGPPEITSLLLRYSEALHLADREISTYDELMAKNGRLMSELDRLEQLHRAQAVPDVSVLRALEDVRTRSLQLSTARLEADERVELRTRECRAIVEAVMAEYRRLRALS